MNIIDQILNEAATYKQAMSQFLRELIAIKSYDGEEGAVIQRIKQEMETIGFDRIEIDGLGNLIGYIGNGSHLIAMDGHADTVTYGDLRNWDFDPFEGMEDEDIIGGLGSTDQKGGIAAMIYAGKIIKNLDLSGDYTLMIVCSVQEEDCDGLCWQYIIEESGIKPEFAVLTEPSNQEIRIGQRGRAEISIKTTGLSSHGSKPELGINAVYKMGPIIGAVEQLNGQMRDDGLLGKGSITISEIYSTSPSRCAVSDSCTISLDRRLNSKETPEFALNELRGLPEVIQANAAVDLYIYDEPSYTGLSYPTKKYYPAWIINREDPACQSMKKTYEKLFQREPAISTWSFSTNGVAIMGRNNIPCVGFGPGLLELAHTPNEKTWKQQLVDCCAVYAYLPTIYLEVMNGEH